MGTRTAMFGSKQKKAKNAGSVGKFENTRKNMKYCFKSVPNVCKYFFFVRKHEK